MTLRFQRILIILLSLSLASLAAMLILKNSKKNIIFFYTPSELIESKLSINQKVRIGGFVKNNSLQTFSTSKNYFIFIVTDNKNGIFVEFDGILPDLFKEGQGTVVEGILVENDRLKADRVFAKHDENYMPAPIKKQIEQIEYIPKSIAPTLEAC